MQPDSKRYRVFPDPTPLKLVAESSESVPKDKLALNITILDPDKLTYRVLMELIKVFRSKFNGRFPDIIEFTPALMDAFRENIGSERDDRDVFLGIDCIIDPSHAESHNER